jgi:N-acetylmuramoyl-L-alanine amidase
MLTGTIPPEVTPVQIKNHKLVGAPFRAAKLTGGPIVPEVVVLHDTAGRLNPGNSVEWLATTPTASVHFVVETDGSITQLVPTNRRAGHAGQSHFHGRDDVNAFSIGIEIVNPGKLTPVTGGGLSWFKVLYPNVRVMNTPEHGHGAWMDYTDAQIAAVEALLLVLFAGIRTLTDITTHWYISPGRKVDTNPLFPLESIRARVLGRDDPALVAADLGAGDPGDDDWVRIVAKGSLNIRRWPSFNPNVIGSVPEGTVVPVLLRGTFAGRQWEKIIFNGQTGWVLSRYTTADRKETT